MNQVFTIIGVALTCAGALLFWPEVRRRGALIKASSRKEIWKTRFGGALIIIGSLLQIIATFFK